MGITRHQTYSSFQQTTDELFLLSAVKRYRGQ